MSEKKLIQYFSVAVLLACLTFSLLKFREEMRGAIPADQQEFFASPERLSIRAEKLLSGDLKYIDSGKICEAAVLLLIGLEKEPLNTKNYLTLSKLLSMDRARDCAPQVSSLSAEAVLLQALENDPHNQELLFSLAEFYFSKERSEESENFLHLYLREVSNPQENLDAARQEYILSKVKSPETLLRIIPQDSEHVIFWSRIYLKKRPILYRQWKASFASLQTAALEKLLQKVIIPSGDNAGNDKLMAELFKFEELAAEDSVRIVIDGKLAQLYKAKGDNVRAVYFDSRKLLRIREINVGYLSPDRMPEKNMLSDWGSADHIYFDHEHSSVGFFSNSGAHLIELRSLDNLNKINTDNLQVFGSVDNKKWDNLGKHKLFVKINFNNKDVIAIDSTNETYRFYKVHFNNSLSEKSLHNNLSKLVRVYGK